MPAITRFTSTMAAHRGGSEHASQEQMKFLPPTDKASHSLISDRSAVLSHAEDDAQAEKSKTATHHTPHETIPDTECTVTPGAMGDELHHAMSDTTHDGRRPTTLGATDGETPWAVSGTPRSHDHKTRFEALSRHFARQRPTMSENGNILARLRTAERKLKVLEAALRQITQRERLQQHRSRHLTAIKLRKQSARLAARADWLERCWGL